MNDKLVSIRVTDLGRACGGVNCDDIQIPRIRTWDEAGHRGVVEDMIAQDKAKDAKAACLAAQAKK